jgi:hypothetical protein
MTLNATRVMALAVAVCATVLAGCGSDPVGTQPATLSDPAGLSGDVQSLDTPLQAAVFQSFSALGASSPISARTVSFLTAMTPARKALATREAAVRKQAFAVKSLRPSFATAPTGAGSLIPETYWGKVYVWSTSTDEYVEGEATGGPATGVRFTLYAINSLTNQPAEPLNPIGYADLTDQSTDTEYKLGVLVADEATTYADYIVAATATQSSFAATAAGFVTDGTHRLDFTNSASASSTHISIDFDLTLNQPDVSAHLHADLVAGDPTTVLTLTFGVTRGSETVVLSGTLGITSTQSGASASANLVIAVNQRQFATVTGTVHSGSVTGYTFDGPDRALTQSERAAVDQLMASPAVLAAAVEPVFAPAEDLVGSSYSLGF